MSRLATPRHLAVLLLVLAVIITAAVLLADPPVAAGAKWPWARSQDMPSSVSGEPVPPVIAAPAARLAIAGDTGTGSDAERATARQMAEQAEQAPYDGLLLLGDLVYRDGNPGLVNRAVLQPFAPVLDQGTELLPVLGNHDYRSGRQQEILRALGRSRPWYVERVGPLRVVVLDSNLVHDPAQTRWLRETLAAPQPAETWTVAAMHHPAYSAGSHGSDRDVQAAWAPLFERYDVPLVLAGHDHDYQRSRPQDGVTYVVSGAGALLRPTGRQRFTAVSSSTLHFLDLLVYDDRLVGRAIDQNGRLVDTFTLTR